MTARLRIALLVLGLTASACTGTVVDDTTPSDSNAANGSLTSAPGSTGTSAGCEVVASDVPWTSDVAATAVVLAEGSSTTPRVEAVVYPHPDYEGKPWSQWGQGLVLDSGRHLSAIGDHRGPDGNSFLYEYDPSTMQLTQIVDLLDIAAHTPGDWGFGKVHAQMVQGPCDTVTVATYWGTRRDIEFTDGYQGDVMVSLDPQRRTAGTRGVIYPKHGVPSLASSPDAQLLYSEAVDPTGETAGAFVVQNATDGTTVFVDEDPRHTGFRSIGVDATGRAFYSIGDGKLAMYDPASNTSTELDAELPGAWLRAVSYPDGQGTLYGVTRDPEFFFSLDPDGNVETFSEAPGYTTSVALSPNGSQLYSVPEAHGKSWQLGAPLLSLDTSTGDLSTVVELQPLAEEHLGLRLGGTYNVAIDRLGKTIYVGMNASQMDDDSGFGEVVLIIVTLP